MKKSQRKKILLKVRKQLFIRFLIHQIEKLVKKLKIANEFYHSKDINDIQIQRPIKDDKNNQSKIDDQIDNEIQIMAGADSIMNDQENENIKPPLCEKEVKRRLREYGQAITFFGESEWQRYKRLHQLELRRMDDIRGDGEGICQKTTIKEILDDFKIRLRESDDVDDVELFLNKIKERNLDPNNADIKTVVTKRLGRETDQEILQGVLFTQKCQDVYLWCKKILREWDFRLQEKFESETAKRSLEGLQAIGTYRQSVDYVKPLLDQLKKQVRREETCFQQQSALNEGILNSLYLIVRYCVFKEYVKAHDKYLELAIGNAPWPMGVTMVGIHERTGRAKIFSSQIAHILNDETQRKYIQSIKRLITVSQKLYPNADPSKMVDFHLDLSSI